MPSQSFQHAADGIRGALDALEAAAAQLDGGHLRPVGYGVDDLRARRALACAVGHVAASDRLLGLLLVLAGVSGQPPLPVRGGRTLVEQLEQLVVTVRWRLGHLEARYPAADWALRRQMRHVVGGLPGRRHGSAAGRVQAAVTEVGVVLEELGAVAALTGGGAGAGAENGSGGNGSGGNGGSRNGSSGDGLVRPRVLSTPSR